MNVDYWTVCSKMEKNLLSFAALVSIFGLVRSHNSLPVMISLLKPYSEHLCIVATESFRKTLHAKYFGQGLSIFNNKSINRGNLVEYEKIEFVSHVD